MTMSAIMTMSRNTGWIAGGLIVATVALTLTVAAEEPVPLSEIGRCWNVASLPPEARAADVTLLVAFDADGRPIRRSIHSSAPIAPEDTATRFAFEAARRAVVRCGEAGYDLPAEYVGTGQSAEITFSSPED
ncbi:hypothetical protein HKCCE3408_01995 [Rhodobacterales bacterium HKCCE3408]|nr:hypothetical protein [Rhodobacterales bacterium HKCCE3408]